MPPAISTPTAASRSLLPLLASSLLAASPPAAAADAADVELAERPKSIRIERTSAPPTLDGRLDEAMWSGAAQITELYQIKPGNGDPASERTEIRLAYDDNAIYVGAILWDRAAPRGLIANNMKHGATTREDDRIGFVFDTFNTRRTGYRFDTNPNGIRHDLLVNGNASNADWTAIWEVATSVHEGYWVAEFAIPFKSLPFDPRNDTWGLNFNRAVRRRGEESVWVSHDRIWGMGATGSMAGLSGMQQGAGLDIVPGATFSVRNDRPAGRRNTRLAPSLDAYYRLTNSLNASVTFNTDFSATEVDDRQVNLSRFGLFFPEKRDFFLNDAELFEFGRLGGSASNDSNNTAVGGAGQENGRPYFSRRLGLSPTGSPVDIEYGAKLSGRAGRWNIGALAIQQDDFVPAAGPLLRAPLVLVARLSANVLSESTLGGIVTSGDAASGNDNTLLGLDFNYRNSHVHGNHTVEGGLWAQRSRSGSVRGRDLAYGGSIAVPSASGWRGELQLRELQQNFNPALGYVSVRGVRQYALDLGHRSYTSGGRIHSWYSGVDLYRLDDTVRGGRLSQRLNVRLLELGNKLEDTVKLMWSSQQENVYAPFTLYADGARSVFVPAGQHRFGDVSLALVSTRARRISGELTLASGSFYDGSHSGIDAKFTLKQSRHFTVNAAADWDRIRLRSGMFISRLMRIGTDVNFTTRLGWASSVQYDNSSELLGVQSRLYYVPKAGQKYSLVLNHALQDPDRDRRFEPTVSESSMRASYTLRF